MNNDFQVYYTISKDISTFEWGKFGVKCWTEEKKLQEYRCCSWIAWGIWLIRLNLSPPLIVVFSIKLSTFLWNFHTHTQHTVLNLMIGESGECEFWCNYSNEQTLMFWHYKSSKNMKKPWNCWHSLCRNILCVCCWNVYSVLDVGGLLSG